MTPAQTEGVRHLPSNVNNSLLAALLSEGYAAEMVTVAQARGFCALACASLVAGCGGIPIWPAPTESTSATAAVAVTTASAASAPPPAADSSAVLPSHVATRSGVAVVAVGAIAFTVDDTGARKFSSGGPVWSATRSLAKQLYGIPRLRPHADEATVGVLAGAPLEAGASPSIHELSELRAALTPDLDNATAHALLESLGRKVDVEGLVVVATNDTGATVAHLVKVEVSPDGDVKAHLDGATFQATEGPAALMGDPPSYSWNAGSIASLLGPAPSAPKQAPPVTAPQALGPRRDAVAAKPPIAANTKPKSKSDEKKSKTIFQSPWFWAAAGGVAAIGVTALVVSQTVNTHSGEIRVQGKVLP